MMKKKRKRSKRKTSFRDPFMYRVVESVSNNRNANKFRVSVDSVEVLCQLPYEGKLSKYTNMMKGWQFRWFILDPKNGTLSYFINENDRLKRPKGWTNLQSAVISPSDEDSNTFTINATSGDCFRLRARDAKVRHDWISRLRAVSQLHSATSPNLRLMQVSEDGSGWNPLTSLKDRLSNAEEYRRLLARDIEELPGTGNLQHLDPDLLTLKALSYAVIVSLNQCLVILQLQFQDSCSNSEDTLLTQDSFSL